MTVQLSRFHAVAIAGLAMLLVLPALLSPPMTHDSFWIDWVWADQFTAELGRGNLYPRWLPESHGGLGSPVFYYYPPLAFYVTGVFGLIGFPTYASIIAAFFLGLLASGFAMHAWLRGHTQAPLAGALLYMAAPYHVMDFYGRGALAESLAIALIPLLALGLRRAADGRIGLAAAAFAGLILTHVPVALLAGVFFAGPYCVYLSRRSAGAMLQAAAALLLGVCLSAIYLIPALLLDVFRDTAKLWADASLQPSNWSILAGDIRGPSPGMRAAFSANLLAVLPAVAMLIAHRTGRKSGIYSLGCIVVAAGLIPGLWKLPLLETVQFPFRMLPLANFGIATGVALMGLSRTSAMLAISPMVALSIYFATLHSEPGKLTIAELEARHPDVPENLPPGDRPFSWPSDWALQVSKMHRGPIQSGPDTIEPVFYFPAWEVRCAGQSIPFSAETRTKLLMHRGGAECDRRLVATVPEKAGGSISLAALLALLVIVVRELGWRRRRSEAAGIWDHGEHASSSPERAL